MSRQWTSLKLQQLTTSNYYHDYLFIFSHLWGKHVSNAIDRSSQHEAPHQETEEHHVWEERAEVHHLSEKRSQHLCSVAMDTLFGGFTVTHSSLSQIRMRREWIPQTTLCLFGHKICANLWNLSKREETSLMCREMSQKSSQYFTGIISALLITGLLNLECEKKESWSSIDSNGWMLHCAVTHYLDEDYGILLLPEEGYSIGNKPISAYFWVVFFFLLFWCLLHNVQDCLGPNTICAYAYKRLHSVKQLTDVKCCKWCKNVNQNWLTKFGKLCLKWFIVSTVCLSFLLSGDVFAAVEPRRPCTFPEDWMPLMTAKQTKIQATSRARVIFQFSPPVSSMELVILRVSRYQK